jgi:hypothetical protein
MNVAARIGLGSVGSAGAIAIGFKIHDALASRTDTKLAEMERSVATSAAEWATWNAKVEDQFPGRALDTPTDHARFEEFLQANPAPNWITVEHTDFTRIRVKTNRLPIPNDQVPVEHQKSFLYPAASGLILGAGGLAALGHGLLKGSAGSTAGNLAKLLAGPIAAGIGVSMLSSGICGLAKGDGLDAVWALQNQVNNS